MGRDTDTCYIEDSGLDMIQTALAEMSTDDVRLFKMEIVADAKSNCPSWVNEQGTVVRRPGRHGHYYHQLLREEFLLADKELDKRLGLL